MSYNLISFTNVSVANRNTIILDKLTLDIVKGKIIAVIGASGSGKTTLLKLISDLLFPERGWQINGNIERFPGLKIAWLNQNPSLEIFKNFVFEEFPHQSKKECLALLKKVSLAYLLEKRCLELSQGEKAMLAILRAFNQDAQLIVLDEVMVNLSAKKRIWLKKIIQDFKNNGGAIVMVEHTPFILDFADTVIFLENGKAKKINKKAAQDFFAHDFAKQTKFAKKKSAAATLEIQALTDSLIASSRKKPVSLKIKAGEIIGISGENGSGKSTLLDIICGIKKPKQGAIFWQGKELKNLRSRKKLMTLTCQDSMQQFFTAKIGTELALTGADLNNAQNKKLLSSFRLEPLLKRDIISLSYGEKQRLAIVFSILSDAKILLFDEPTYGLDRFTIAAFLKAMRILADQNRVAIIASHETGLLGQLADKVIRL